MRKPDFFIVGAPKSGTTAMYEYLQQHPDIFLPPGGTIVGEGRSKELHYFGSDLYKRRALSLKEYLSFFDGATDEKRIGQAGVWLLYSKLAAREIRAFNPNAQAIIMLRNPIEKIPSQHSQALYNGSENLYDLKSALAAEKDRKKGNRIPDSCSRPEVLLYRETARYSEQVERYVEEFGWKNLHIIVYDDFKKDPADVYRDLLQFLGVDKNFLAEFRTVNPNKRIKIAALQRLIKDPPKSLVVAAKSLLPASLRRRLLVNVWRFNTRYEQRVPIDPTLRQELQQEFTTEVECLGELLGRDLTYWIKD